MIANGYGAAMEGSNKEKKTRWVVDWSRGVEAEAHELGDHAASRYRRFRRFIEHMGEDQVTDEFFGLLLTAESVVDELRVFEMEELALVRLAQTGTVVHHLRRLHAVLDTAIAYLDFEVDELSEKEEWEAVLRKERRERADWHRCNLGLVDSGGVSSLLTDVDSDDKAEEVLTLLKATIDRFGPDSDADAAETLTLQELNVIQMAFDIVATHSNIVIMTLPTWFVLPFEFAATFGMSTWGNDRFVPKHADKERFIKEASGWSELNHPHVAKFLGACHVGDEMFVVHEKTRPMTEYAIVAEGDRKKVWERVYEVGLALQYMFERGYACPDVVVDHLYCAQYEDRAVMLGVHLRECTGIDDKKSVLMPNQSQQSLFDDTWIESLVIAIVRVLDSMNESVNEEPSAEVDDQKVIEAYRDMESGQTSIPACIDDHEWRLLKQLREITDGEFLRVVDTLGELAEVHSRHDWLEYVQILECQIEGITRVKDMKATLMGETIDQLLLKCRDVIPATNQPLCSLVRRYDNIIGQLQQRFDEQSDWSTLLKPIAHLCSLLRQFSNFIQQKTQTSSLSQSLSMSVSVSASVSATSSTAYSQQTVRQLDPGRVYSLHSKLDQFLILHELSSSSQIHDWLKEWKDEYRSISSSLIDHEISVTFDTEKELSTRSSVLSRWFIPREQIEFDERGAFSEGAFGSVHKGKWFETPVIVKRVKQHTTTETQFRQEADVWFQLNHINVVKMYGACDIGDLFFVCEYASGGDLDKYLVSKGRDLYLMWYCLLNAALGLQYLHNNGIVHADLKANNILVGGDGVAKLTDFGLSVRAKDPSGAAAGALGAYQWKAPECLSGSVATFASDVYSFAMVMIEVMSGSCPWGEDTDNDTLKNFVVTRGRLPPRPSSIGDSEWGLIERMCVQDPSARVKMDTVVTHLSSLLQRLDQGQLWFGGVYNPKTFRNHVVTRGGMLLSLIDLAQSQNTRVASNASNQIISVAVSRNGPPSLREINAVLHLLYNGADRQKTLAARALVALAESSFSAVMSTKLVSSLVTMINSGTSEMKTEAANAIGTLSSGANISEAMLAARGVDVLVQLLRDGSDEQKTYASVSLANLTARADISENVLAVRGVEELIILMQMGNGSQKKYAARALSNISADIDITKSVLGAQGVDTLVQLLRDGTDDQKTPAAIALANISADANIKEELVESCGIDALLQLVHQGTGSQKLQAAITLANVSSVADISEPVLANGGIEVLVHLMGCGNNNEKRAATMTLGNLSNYMDISEQILEVRGIHLLVELMRDGTEDLKDEAAAALANLSGHRDMSAAVLDAQGIEPLVQLVRDGTDNQKHTATMVLANLSNWADISNSVTEAQGVNALVELVRDGTEEQILVATASLANLSEHADISASVIAVDGIDVLMKLARKGTRGQKKQARRAISNLSKSPRVEIGDTCWCAPWGCIMM